MFTGAHRRQIKYLFGKKVSSHGVHFLIKERTPILIISGKSVADRQLSVFSH
jgi:hypothetical protein